MMMKRAVKEVTHLKGYECREEWRIGVIFKDLVHINISIRYKYKQIHY